MDNELDLAAFSGSDQYLQRHGSIGNSSSATLRPSGSTFLLPIEVGTCVRIYWCMCVCVCVCVFALVFVYAYFTKPKKHICKALSSFQEEDEELHPKDRRSQSLESR